MFLMVLNDLFFIDLNKLKKKIHTFNSGYLNKNTEVISMFPYSSLLYTAWINWQL